MERDQALAAVQSRVQNVNLLKHMYAVEAVMGKLARRLGGEEKKWALAGLLHDIDYEETAGAPERHSLAGAEILGAMGLPPDIVYAVKVHNPAHGLPRQSLMDSALYSADPLTGLIVAAALVHPKKKLAPLDPEFVGKRFAEKQFARGANREQIARCTPELGLALEEFIALGLGAMQGIAPALGL